jgi:hypothetical protein
MVEGGPCLVVEEDVVVLSSKWEGRRGEVRSVRM